MLPHLDRHLLQSFLRPFLVTLFVAWFSLLMQFLWHFLETIAGKGISFFVVLELIGYRSVALFPVALPLACLIATVMTIGGMAERYEISSFHSAGVSPGRILRSLLFAGAVIGLGSYLTADYLVPATNFKFLERLREVQFSDAALNIEEGVFNHDLPGFTILVKEKTGNGALTDVILYEEPRLSVASQLKLISSKSGRLAIDPQTELAQLSLFDGGSFREEARSGRKPTLVRTTFKRYTRQINLADMNVPNFSGDANHYSLLTSGQLQHAADSVRHSLDSMRRVFWEKELFFQPPPVAASSPSGKLPVFRFSITAQDSLRALSKAKSRSRTTVTQARYTQQSIAQEREVWVKYVYRKHEKFSLALVCLLFVMVGGGMGTIVRSGNFGFPVLVSVTVFVAYIMGSIFCRRLAESFVLHPVGAGWVPATVVLFVGILLVRQSG